jgi:hypothetical protein
MHTSALVIPTLPKDGNIPGFAWSETAHSGYASPYELQNNPGGKA